MQLREATMKDLQQITNVEKACFSQAEAATKEAFKDRITHYPNHFFVLEDKGAIVAFINGMVSDSKTLLDEMYAQANLHQEDGAWQMIFGLATTPSYRRRGCARQLMEYMIKSAQNEKRLGLVLTCKQHLVSYYATFGFVDEGICESEHGGVAWHQMRLTF